MRAGLSDGIDDSLRFVSVRKGHPVWGKFYRIRVFQCI